VADALPQRTFKEPPSQIHEHSIIHPITFPPIHLASIGVKYEAVNCSVVRRAGGVGDAKNAHPEKRVPALIHT